MPVTLLEVPSRAREDCEGSSRTMMVLQRIRVVVMSRPLQPVKGKQIALEMARVGQ